MDRSSTRNLWFDYFASKHVIYRFKYQYNNYLKNIFTCYDLHFTTSVDYKNVDVKILCLHDDRKNLQHLPALKHSLFLNWFLTINVTT